MSFLSNAMKWKNLFNMRDYNKLYNLYSNDTVLIPTFSNKVIYGKKNLKFYFEDIDKNIKVELTSVNQKKDCDINILYGTYTFYNNNTFFHKANYSFYYKFNTLENRYLIHHHHSSIVPNFKN